MLKNPKLSSCLMLGMNALLLFLLSVGFIAAQDAGAASSSPEISKFNNQSAQNPGWLASVRGRSRVADKPETRQFAGVIIDGTGFLITTAEAVDADDVEVLVSGDASARWRPALVVGADNITNLAVLKIEPDAKRFDFDSMENSDSVKAGDLLVAFLGPKKGSGMQVLRVTSSTGEKIEMDAIAENAITLDPGSPILDQKGHVVAIKTAHTNLAILGMSYTSSNVIGRIYNKIRRQEPSTTAGGTIGVSFLAEENQAFLLSLGTDHGVVITGTQDNGPAAKAGLKWGDVIVSLNGSPVKDGGDLLSKMRVSRVGETLTIRYMRDHREQEAKAVIGDRSSAAVIVDAAQGAARLLAAENALMQSRTGAGNSAGTVSSSTRSGATGTACPDWSPKFDQIDDPDLVQPLQQSRQQGWDNLIQAGIAGGASLQQQIRQGQLTRDKMRLAYYRDEQDWVKIGVGNLPRLTANDCKRSDLNAAMAVACDQHLQKNGILALEGTLDLMRCRAGMAPVAGTQFGPSPAAPSPSPGSAPQASAPAASSERSQPESEPTGTDDPRRPAGRVQ